MNTFNMFLRIRLIHWIVLFAICAGPWAQAQSSAIVSITSGGTGNDRYTTEQWRGAAQWAVTRTGGNLSAPLTVFYTVGGTATPNVDYRALGGSVVIPAGRTSAEVLTNAYLDAIPEPDESIIITLKNGTGYAIGSPSSTACYVIDLSRTSGPKPEVNITSHPDGVHPNRTTELNREYAFWNIVRTGDLRNALSVSYTVSGTATAGLDYDALSGSVEIPPGSASVYLSTRAMPDSVNEPDETIEVTLNPDDWYILGSSKTATGYVVNHSAPVATPYPTAPTDLNLSVVSSYQIDLSWADRSNNESGFQIERKIGTGSYAQLATVHANVTTYRNFGLSPSTRYSYRVRAVNTKGNSAYSNEASNTTPGVKPRVPGTLSLSVMSPTDINLNWSDRSNNETGFIIERKSGSSSFARIAAVNAGVRSYLDAHLSPNTYYTYRVCATNGAGNSDYTNEVLGRTLVLPTPPPRSDLFNNPFNKWSAHHRPVGKGAIYGMLQSNGSRTRGRLNVPTSIRLATTSGIKYQYRVDSSDKKYQVTWSRQSTGGGLPVVTRIPNGVDLPYPGKDNNALFFPKNGDPNSTMAQLFYGFQIPSPGVFQAGRYMEYDLKGTDVGGGSSASRIKHPSGCIRRHELVNLFPMNHCLEIDVTRKGANPAYHVLGKNWRWPATGRDSTAGHAKENLGDIDYGTRIAIRPIDKNKRDTLGLSERGKILFDCMLYYGVIVMDGATPLGTLDKPTGAKVDFRCDQDIPKAIQSETDRQLALLWPLLWPIENTRPLNRETEVWTDGKPYAGGGGPLDPVKSMNTAWDAN